MTFCVSLSARRIWKRNVNFGAQYDSQTGSDLGNNRASRLSYSDYLYSIDACDHFNLNASIMVKCIDSHQL